MRRLPLVCFVILWLVAGVLASSQLGHLPERVAVHFDAAGVPNGFMSRAGCRTFMLGVTLGIPLLIALATGVLPRLLPPALINLPNRDYWLAPERAGDSIDFLSEQGVWFGCIMLPFLAAVDWMLVRANTLMPPQFPTEAFEWSLALFFAATGLWMLRILRRFRAAPGGS